MEGIVGLVLVIIAIAAIYWVIVNVIMPIAGVLSSVALIGGIGYAFIVSIQCFCMSVAEHWDPYTSYADKNPDNTAGLRRSYFFGPGYHQIKVTVADAFIKLKERVDHLTEWMDGIKRKLYGKWYVSMWVWMFYIIAYICTFFLGFAWMTVFSTILFAIVFTGMCAFYALFTLLWCVDRLVLAVKSIQSRCGNCKRISIVPNFLCPACGEVHRNLTPGPYGTFRRECVCGERLPTTFLNGRSTLKAFCPFCTSDLAASDACQVGIQLVGGSGSGKTTFLAAFWHEYIERLKKMQSVSYTAEPLEAFDELEYWFQQGYSSATSETNANMYSLIHYTGNKTPVQMTVYDIAGEAFTSLANDTQQQQFQYCEGIIFIMDPTATPEYASEVITGFINEFVAQKGRHSTKRDVNPVAVVISKADLYKQKIGIPKIKAIYRSSAKQYADAEGNVTFASVRSGVCRAFLSDIGFDNAMNLIDAAFQNVQYYSISAMGHPTAVDQKYEPWGVLEPVMWLLWQSGMLSEHILSLMGVAIEGNYVTQ